MEPQNTIVEPASLAAELKKRQPFVCPAQEAYLNLMRTYSVLLGPMERLFKQQGISPAKYNILRILRGSKNTGECGSHGLPSLEIADRLITRVPDITRLVDGLEANDLVIRTRCTDDRRVVYVGITEDGLALLDQLDHPLMQLHQQTLAHLDEDELKELNRLLVKARHGAESAE
jgi:DNA-binding MarR family transcriptional regulator